MRDAVQYQQWLDGEIPLPPLKTGPEMIKACKALVSRLRPLRKALAENQQWEDFVAFQRTRDYISRLLTLHDSLQTHLPAGMREDFNQKIEQVTKSYYRMLRGTARHPALRVLRGWLRRKHDRLSKAQRDRVEAEIADLVDYRAKKALDRDPTETLFKQQLRRSERQRLSHNNAPLILAPSQARLLPRHLRARCAEFARSVGVAGFAVPFDRLLGFEVGSFLTCSATRAALDAYLKVHRETDATTSKMIDLRTARARGEGFHSFAHEQMSDTSMRSPRKVIGALSSVLQTIGPAHDRLLRAISKRLARDGETLNCELDVAYMLRRAHDHGCQNVQGAFPTARTLRLIIPELVRCGGWRASAPRRANSKSPGWTWNLTHENGRVANLVIFPSVVCPAEASSGEHSPVVSTLSEEGPIRGMSVINLFFAEHSNYLTRADLGALCHEVGHALHNLAPVSKPLHDPWNAVGTDMVEFPSQLLELYCQDPRALARWADAKKNPDFAKPSFWAAAQQIDNHSLHEHTRTILSAWCDITLHACHYRNPVVSEHYRRGLKRFSLPADYAPELPYLKFIWDKNYAGCDFTYPLGEALANHLGCMHHAARIDCREIARTFRFLQDKVLAKSIDPASFRKNMREWTGEDFNTFVRHALESRGRTLRQQYRAAAQAVAAC